MMATYQNMINYNFFKIIIRKYEITLIFIPISTGPVCFIIDCSFKDRTRNHFCLYNVFARASFLPKVYIVLGASKTSTEVLFQSIVIVHADNIYNVVFV